MTTGVLGVLMEGVLSLLFPPRCEVCGVLQEPVVCASCLEKFTPIAAPVCRVCGLPLDSLAKAPDLCLTCREEPAAFDVARAAGLYGGALRRAIHIFKYDGVRALARPLAAFMTAQIALPMPVDALCPVPLHMARERMRGYNQSRLLAEELGTQWGVPVLDALARVVNTPPQIHMTAEERRRNVKGAFTAIMPVDGRTVGLIDDVYTTGSTLRECSRVLKAAGATRVVVLTTARAVAETETLAA